MKLRNAFLALFAVAAVSSPAAADGLSPWGVWSDGSQLKKSRQQPGFGFGMSGLGADPALMGPGRPAPVALAQGGARPNIAPNAPAKVSFDSEYGAGAIIIDTAGRKLYYTLPNGEALSYPIAVGKQGFAWTGSEKISKIVDWPDWTPPEEMRQRKPNLPLKMTGGINNPLGAKAIYLGNTLYRIHGTNDSSSIGTAASSGCFRMHNGHVVHLASMVNAGTPVHILKKLPAGILAGPGQAKKSQDI